RGFACPRLSEPGGLGLPEGRVREGPGGFGEGTGGFCFFRIVARTGLAFPPAGRDERGAGTFRQGQRIFGPGGPSGGKIPGLFETKGRSGSANGAGKKGKLLEDSLRCLK